MDSDRRLKVIGVAALAVVAIALAIFALRQPKAPDAGQPLPLPSVTTPVESPSLTSPAAIINGQPNTWLVAASGSVVWRAVPGCAKAPRLQVSQDHGKTWKTVASPAPHLLDIRALSATSATVIAADAQCSPVAFTSSDGGATWQQQSDVGATWFVVSRQVHTPTVGLSPACRLQPPIAVAAADSSRAVVLCPFGVRRTTNRGLRWRTVTSFPAGNLVAASMLGDGRGIVLVTGHPGCAGALVAQTASAGQTWLAGSCLGVVAGRAGVALEPDGSGVAVVGNDVFATTNAGGTWRKVS